MAEQGSAEDPGNSQLVERVHQDVVLSLNTNKVEVCH